MEKYFDQYDAPKSVHRSTNGYDTIPLCKPQRKSGVMKMYYRIEVMSFGRFLFN